MGIAAMVDLCTQYFLHLHAPVISPFQTTSQQRCLILSIFGYIYLKSQVKHVQEYSRTFLQPINQQKFVWVKQTEVYRIRFVADNLDNLYIKIRGCIGLEPECCCWWVI